MSRKLAHHMNIFKKSKNVLLTALSIGAVFLLMMLFDVQNTGNTHSVQATSTATTTVTVLNTPPVWTVTAREWYASATTTPTNVGTSTWWTAIGTDSNAESYYLLICKSSSTPIAVAGGAPRCGGGGTDQWAVSAATASGASSTVATTTQDAWATKNNWFGYICDGNAGSPRCNDAQFNGLHETGAASATSSPFVVNHRPTLTWVADDSPTFPGATTTWTSSSADADGDNVKLHICKATDFNVVTSSCGPGGFWASSTFAGSNVTAEGYIVPPAQDRDTGAFAYLVDVFGSVSASLWNGSSTVLTIANATPSVVPDSLAVFDVFGSTTPDYTLALTTEEGQTDNFVVQFDVLDNNSCEAFGGGQEISDVDINIFRSGKGGIDGTGCNISGQYNVNDCYTDTNPFFTPTCYQVPGDCAGPGQSTVQWECTFSLWYVADPTDVGSIYAAQDWRGTARATDDDVAVSTYGTSSIASEMTQFLSFRATGTPIAYGSLEPGQQNATHLSSTTVYATGNTGLNNYLSGDAMCVGYPNPCTGNATSTIYVPYQHYSLVQGDTYANGLPLSTSTSPTFVNAIIGKTTSTSSPTNDSTYWAIAVPSSITYAGDYVGRNYIDAVVAPSGEW